MSIECPGCLGYGARYFPSRIHPGWASSNDCDLCDGDGEIDVSPLATLVHNLAVAAFGAAMFRAGDNFGFHMGEDQGQCTCQWSPGRGVPYKGSTRCESDCDDYDYSASAAELDDDEDYDPVPGFEIVGPNGCTCGHNGDCNCRFVP